jgi:transposase
VRKRYRPWTPRQTHLLPPSPLDWLPEDHLVYFVLDVVERLDVREIEDAIARKDPRGERPYDPRMMLALLLYGYCVGVFSSRKLARATYEDVPFRVLGGGGHPHFTAINNFRLDHRGALPGLFLQVLKLCARAGLVKLGHVSLDGAKILANASKHKAMSYERMTKEEARLKAEIEAMLTRADDADRREDERFGAGKDAKDLPEELRRRETRLRKIQEAMAALKREAAEARAAELRELADAQRAKVDDPSVDPIERKRAQTRADQHDARADELDGGSDDDPPAGAGDDLPHHRVPATPDGEPKPNAQRNFTDPESRIMLKGGAFVQAYNVQIVVDSQAQVILAEAVTNQPPDPQHLTPLLDRTLANVGRAPDALSADNGYYTDENVADCEARRVDPFLAVGRIKRGSSPADAVQATSSSPVKEQMRAKLATAEGRAIYARRKVIAEPPFGQIQAARGFRRFSLRGLSKVRSEWTLVCLTHNLLKLFRGLWTDGTQPIPAV